MKTALPVTAALLSLSATLSAASLRPIPGDATKLTVERVVGDPALSGPEPRAVKFSPDGRCVTYLKGKKANHRQLDLWAYDVKTGQDRLLVDSDALGTENVELSAVEKARRERQRISDNTGIVEYSWDEAGDAVLVPAAGDLFYVALTGDEPTVRRLTQTDAYETDARISPGGGYVSFIRDQNLYVIRLATGEEQAITTEGSGPVSFGMAEFVAQEEMDRDTGYWWSDDDRYLAFERADESPIDIVTRLDIGPEGVTVDDQRYPRAGTDNARVSLFVHDLGNGDRTQVDLGANEDIYLARVAWLDPHTLAIQRENRQQTELDLLAASLETGKTSPLVSQRSEVWINLSDDFKPLEDSDAFLWTSEASGYRHIRLFDRTGREVRQVTSGDWAVDKIEGVNESKGLVYFTGRKDTPLERQLYVVSYRKDESEPRRITAPGGMWSVAMNEDATAFVGTYSDPDQPPRVALYDADGKRIRWIEQNALDGDHPYAPFLPGHIAPQFGTIATEDGTPLYYKVYRPSQCTASHPCPAIQRVYGGPHAQMVTHGWGDLADQLYARQGYVVFWLDNRGSANRGLAFEGAIRHAMAGVEVRDQLAGLRYLKSRDYVDGNRVGVTGWSYGGYMTLHLAMRSNGAYAAAVAGAPVTDWTLYDTHYTERYMGTPQGNADGYEASSAVPYVDDLETPLLMLHGMADDNVTFDNSTRVYAALQAADKPFEMMVYPGQRHHIGGAGREAHLLHTVLSFFAARLHPGSDPGRSGHPASQRPDNRATSGRG